MVREAARPHGRRARLVADQSRRRPGGRRAGLLKGRADGALINAAALTHSSLASRDALLAVQDSLRRAASLEHLRPRAGTAALDDRGSGGRDGHRLRRAELPAGPAGAGGPAACRLTAGCERQAALRARWRARGWTACWSPICPTSATSPASPDRRRCSLVRDDAHHPHHRLPLRGAGAERGRARPRRWRSIRRASGIGWAGCWRPRPVRRWASRPRRSRSGTPSGWAGLTRGRVVPTTDLVERLRAVKSPEEVAAIRAAASWPRPPWPRCCRASRPGRPSWRWAPRWRPRSGAGAASGTRFPPSWRADPGPRCRTRAPARGPSGRASGCCLTSALRWTDTAPISPARWSSAAGRTSGSGRSTSWSRPPSGGRWSTFGRA